jgi:hypothetical protein
VDKEKLLARRLADDTVMVDGVGEVQVRALSRKEVMNARKFGGGDLAKMEQFMLHKGMVDPELTLDEVEVWQDGAPAGEIEPIARKIAALSGMGFGEDRPDKAAFKSV